MDEHSLITRLQNGEDDAYREVVDRYQRMVLNCAFKFLRDPGSAEDLAQEVFLEVFESVRSFRREAQLSTWIYRITVTRALNRLRSLKRKKRFAPVISLFVDQGDSSEIADPHTPLNATENAERAAILTRVLGQLPANQRIAFTLSTIEGLRYQEIASVMNTSVPAVEALIHRARTNLRKKLRTYYRDHET